MDNSAYLDAPTAQLGAAPQEGDTLIGVLFDLDGTVADTAKMVVVRNAKANTPATPVAPSTGRTTTLSGSTITINYDGTAPDAFEIQQLVKDCLVENGKIGSNDTVTVSNNTVTVNGVTLTVTVTENTYNAVIAEGAKLNPVLTKTSGIKMGEKVTLTINTQRWDFPTTTKIVITLTNATFADGTTTKTVERGTAQDITEAAINSNEITAVGGNISVMVTSD